MFFRPKNYQFNDSLKSQQNQVIEQKFNYQAKIILYGSLASSVVSAMGATGITANEQGVYELRYIEQGDVSFNVRMNATLQIKYKETKKRNGINPVLFQHDDKFSNSLDTISSTTTQFKQGKYNVNSKYDTILVIAGKDKQEVAQLIKDLEIKLKPTTRILKSHIAQYSDKIEGYNRSWTHDNIELPHILYHCIYDVLNPKSVAESIRVRISVETNGYFGFARTVIPVLSEQVFRI